MKDDKGSIGNGIFDVANWVKPVAFRQTIKTLVLLYLILGLFRLSIGTVIDTSH
jgi:hypothetical protein